MGMYDVLKLINEQLISELKVVRFTTKDLSEISGLSVTACSNNLNRLMRAGLLVKEESVGKDCNGHVNKRVCYRLNFGAAEFIRDHLYEEEKELKT